MTNTEGHGTIGCPGIWEKMAMKASSLFVAGPAVAILSIAPANAEKNQKKCTGSTWPAISAVPCQRRPYIQSLQLRRMHDDGEETRVGRQRRLVVLQQSGVQELTNPRAARHLLVAEQRQGRT
jgi:hypothetical protein